MIVGDFNPKIFILGRRTIPKQYQPLLMVTIEVLMFDGLYFKLKSFFAFSLTKSSILGQGGK
jgi:hypothetical protein